jgi:hypothetical protein
VRLHTDPENTLTSPALGYGGQPVRLLALTILWHPELYRVGEQFIAGGRESVIEVSRFAPLFAHPGELQRPLADRCVAREALVLRLMPGGALSVTPPASRMRVVLDGQAVETEATVPADELDAGLVVELGGSVLLCVHWRTSLPTLESIAGLVGVSSAMQQVRRMIRQVAATDVPVLVLGETGTGKELAACAIHDAGRQRDDPFVAVNMAALSDIVAAAELFGERGVHGSRQYAYQLFCRGGAWQPVPG